jgi:hypothetical protein
MRTHSHIETGSYRFIVTAEHFTIITALNRRVDAAFDIRNFNKQKTNIFTYVTVHLRLSVH